jgi:hypothetical protein
MNDYKGHMVLKEGELSQKSMEYISAIQALRYLEDGEIFGVVEAITKLDLLLMEKVEEKLKELGHSERP